MCLSERCGELSDTHDCKCAGITPAEGLYADQVELHQAISVRIEFIHSLTVNPALLYHKLQKLTLIWRSASTWATKGKQTMKTV